MRNLSPVYKMHQNVAQALDRGMAVVALESAVLTHGLPHPDNEELGLELEEIIKENGAAPATIALINGMITIGITANELSKISTAENPVKVSSRMMGIGIAKGLNGGTTVAATLVAAHAAGIQVFATGGIGGVHRGKGADISADLDELARRPIIVVCAGAKSILDLPATLEALETRSVPVLGYQTDEFPAFYTQTSGLKVDVRIDTPVEAAEIARAHWQSGNQSAVLVCNPLPENESLDAKEINNAINAAVVMAETRGISGAAVTPFLLETLNKLTHGKSVQANLTLLHNNARLAAQIAASMAKSRVINY